MLLSSIIPKHCTLTAKRSLKFVPILGWFGNFPLMYVWMSILLNYFLYLGSVAGVIFVERKKGSTAVEALKAAAHDIKKTQVKYHFSATFQEVWY